MTALGLYGRDLTQLLAPARTRRQPMVGFDDDYADIVDYIVRCTHRIWEQKDVGLIASHYASTMTVHTMAGPTLGSHGVIAATAGTLAGFPDRTLTAEAVIWSDESCSHAGIETYLSSHRITSTATNLGASELGAATGRRITFTTIADCLCQANRIIEEWLVRDYSAMALALGYAPRAVARQMAAADRAASERRADWRLEQLAAIDGRTTDAARAHDGLMPDATDPHAFAHAYFDRLLNNRRFGDVRYLYSPAAHWAGPGGRQLFGWGEITGWLIALIASFGDLRVRVDHVAAVDDMIAVRWSASGTHDGAALYGAPSSERVYLLAVTHWQFADGLIIDETTIFDEVALLRQIEGGL